MSEIENDIYGSIGQENQYLELQEPQRLRSTSSGRFDDQDSDTDSEVNYYNFLYVRPHSAPRKRLVVKGLSLPTNLLVINDFDITRFSYDGDIFHNQADAKNGYYQSTLAKIDEAPLAVGGTS